MTRASLSPAIIKETLLYRSTAIPSPIRRQPKPVVRAAAIVGDLLFDLLRFDCRLELLRQRDWRARLADCGAEFLIVESVPASVTGDWAFAQTPETTGHAELVEVIEEARRLKIPTVYWITADQRDHEHFAPFAQHFDLVYFTDPRAEAHISHPRKRHLPPAIQPAIFHPFRPSARSQAGDKVLYDGIVDLLSPAIRPHLSILERLDVDSLDIVETHSRLRRSAAAHGQESLLGNGSGYIHPEILPDILRSAFAYLSVGHSLRSETLQSWKMLQAAACRAPTVHIGALGADDFRNALAIPLASDDDGLKELGRMKDDLLYREGQAHRAWRTAHENHTAAHRLTTILTDLGISHDLFEGELVTIVTPSRRPELAAKILRQFDEQTYPHKELIVVANGAAGEWQDLQRQSGNRPDVRMVTLSTDFHAGAALNLGIGLARGSWCFRMDDDDIYGPHYIADTMLGLRSVEADVVGKGFALAQFENDPEMFVATHQTKSPTVLAARELDYKGTSLSGCSIGGRKSLFEAVPYPNDNAGSADAEFMLALRQLRPEAVCLLTDVLNLIVIRHADVTKHTWRAPNGMIKGKMIKSGWRTEDGIV